ncbi:radical SAM family heme chaperone HemW [Pseudodesulfovibrio piezophilus]|uniref:Heme chaperone HemW n=1 Tax=Pseudodesulfovibrio piezophilus (strain DSM 21447 / JCM 15486 / C1TLV30) TaxID=1322246 RepID=M1WRP9_PSEP2|nr:radical SAM family heme chaperone HemW [Pseudodesulfovibrio piezophilus]CCH49699.1 Oxygen-independent coproporphyrinogen III oxidase [Pseudodesulfovibrio piezophilus C1TLV30]
MGTIYGEGVPVKPAFPTTGGETVSVGKRTGKGLLLYIHVPFCQSRCHYCTFHSQAFNQVTFAWYHKLLLDEIKLWGKRLKKPQLATIYFGGGTPSLIPLQQMHTIMKAMETAFSFTPGMEISLEANPDSAHDVSYFRALLSMGFNRLSLGMQSLRDEDLHLMGRPHSVNMAYASYDAARHAGFGNIGVDLIWGLPGQRLKGWIEQLTTISDMRPEHISAYNLTLEEGTVMHKLCGEGGELAMPSEQEQGRMFIYGAEFLESVGYMHYEVSNFARMGFMSAHNSGYWTATDYLGLGPSAVSTIGRRRFSNPKYMDEYDAYVRGGLVGNDHETLSDEDVLKETVMLSLRTTKGLNLADFRKQAGYDLIKRHESLITALHRENLIRLSHGFLRLTKNGMLVSNIIIRRLAFDSD